MEAQSPSSQLTCWDCEGGMGMEGGKSNCADGSPVPRPCPIMPCEECCCEGAAALSSTDAWNRASATTPPERFCECERPAWAKLWLAPLKSKFDCVKLCCDNDRGSWDSLSHDWSTMGGAGKPAGSKLVCGGWELTEGGRIMGWAATTAGSMWGAGTTGSWQVSPHTPPLLLSKQLNGCMYREGGRGHKHVYGHKRERLNVHAWLWVYTFENEHMARIYMHMSTNVCVHVCVRKQYIFNWLLTPSQPWQWGWKDRECVCLCAPVCGCECMWVHTHMHASCYFVTARNFQQPTPDNNLLHFRWTINCFGQQWAVSSTTYNLQSQNPAESWRCPWQKRLSPAAVVSWQGGSAVAVVPVSVVAGTLRGWWRWWSAWRRSCWELPASPLMVQPGRKQASWFECWTSSPNTSC